MGISLLTILTIKSNGDDIQCVARQCEKTKKWGGEIYLCRVRGKSRLLIDEKVAGHTSEELAVEFMKSFVQDIRAGRYSPAVG